MTNPAKLWLQQDGQDARKASSSQHLCVGDPVLPLYAEDFSEACRVKVVQLLRMALVDRPYFTAIEQCGENYGPAHLYLGLYGDASLALHVLVESA